ncbi:MAG: hypothetical protein EU533_00895 [Promethearchaeota archaeon]|nr:MAG: hypothetical protein EU533_00895 [Candidatus Lokiarchaeota archaeon]
MSFANRNHKRRKIVWLSLIFCIIFLGNIELSLFRSNNLQLDNVKYEESDKKTELKEGLDTAAYTCSGIGKTLNVSEFGNGNFQSNNLNLTNNDKASIVVPNSWNVNEISANVFNIRDHDEYFLNETFDSGDYSNHWTNYTNNNPYVSFDGYNAPSGANDSIYMRFEESGSSWINKYAYWNYTFDVPREQIPYAYWNVSFKYRALYSSSDWLPGSSSSHLLGFHVNEAYQEFGISKMDPVIIYNNTWQSGSFQFQPEIYNFHLPGTISLIFKLDYKNSGINPTGYFEMYYDNITLTLSTIPKPSQINLSVTDETHDDTVLISDGVDYGEGSLNFQNTWNGDIGGKTHYFSFSHNSSGNVIISSEQDLKASSSKITTTQLGLEGCEYIAENNSQVEWTTFFTVSQPSAYSTDYYINITKPSNWVITEVIDPYLNNKINDVLGTGYGNSSFEIPNSIITNGLWKIVAESSNYVNKVDIYKKNNQEWMENNTFYPLEKFKVNASASIDLINNPELTNASLSIFYPNGTIFFEENTTVNSDGTFEFSEITLGQKNATIGTYSVCVKWSESIDNMTQIGFYQLNLVIFHHTSLTPVDSYFEQTAGEPLLIKVEFMDDDLNTSIDFADVQYKSSFGTSGMMAYLGTGIYFAVIDTNGLSTGDYYFSINASKHYFENHTTTDLIHLKLTAQPLKLIFTSRLLNSSGNEYTICKLNLEGEISGNPVDGANVSTNWINDEYDSISDLGNGTYILNFSTNGLPLEGVTEAFEIEILANKTNYKSVSDYVTLIVHPVATLAKANQTNFFPYINEDFEVKVNYTEEDGKIISEAEYTVSWVSDYEITNVTDGIIIKYYTTNLEMDVYNSLIRFSKPGYEDALVSITVVVNELETNMSVQINRIDIAQNSLVEVYFKEEVNITARIFAEQEGAYLTGGSLTFLSNNYQNIFTEISITNFELVFTINGANFSSGLNSIFLRYEKQNYSTAIFSFQFYIRAQNVILEVEINHESIPENYLIEAFSKENLTISCRAFAEIEEKYLSGGAAVLITDLNEISLSENPTSWYNRTFTINPDLLLQGINYVYLKFDLANYTTATFSFQIYVRAQNVILEVKLDDEFVPENYLKPVEFNQILSISCSAFAEIEEKYLSGGTINLIIDSDEINLPEYPGFWYNGTFSISSDLFSLGINYVYLKFEHVNYTTTTFSIQIQVNQIEIEIHTIDFSSSIEMYSGTTKLILINLTESNSNKPITNATVICYSEDFGQIPVYWQGEGVYNLTLGPFSTLGTHQFRIIITPKENLYKPAEYRFDLIISERQMPNYLMYIIIFGLIGIIGALGILSVRSYVILPRKRRKHAAITEKTQPYKDIRNVESIICSSKSSGLSLYYKTFSIIDEDYITGFSGFIQAITILEKQYTKNGEKKRDIESTLEESEGDAYEMKELDFNFFNSLICDYKNLRIILVLRELSSERLRNIVQSLTRELFSECEELITQFTGNLDGVSPKIEKIVYKHLPLYYKENFGLNKGTHYHSIKLSGDLSNLEIRFLNILEAQSKFKPHFLLETALSMVENVSEDKKIIAIESLIEKGLIKPVK